MKTAWAVVLLAGLLGAGAALGQNPPPSDANRPGPPDQPQQRMERAQHQPDMQPQQGGMAIERRRMMNAPPPEQSRPFQMQGPQQGPPPPMASCPMTGRKMHCLHAAGLIFLFCGIIHLLLTVWVYQDIRKRNAGSGIWIVVTLMTGLLGAAVYALVRLGDKQT
jgi:hypothetical protein